MKNKIKKYIEDDFNKSYKCNVDVNKIIQNANIQIQEEPIKKKSFILKPIYQIVMICVLVLVMSFTIVYINLDNKSDDILTCEFKKYMKSYEVKYTEEYDYSIKVGKDLKIYIFKCYNLKNDNNDYLFYIFKSKQEISNCYIIIDNDKTSVIQDSFGLLKIIDENTIDKSIKFSVEINGEIKDFVLN